MKKNYILLISLLSLCGCNNTNIFDEGKKDNSTNTNSSVVDESSVVASTSAIDPESSSIVIESDFSITSTVSDGYTVSNNIYTITKAGEYTLSGNLQEGEIYVNAAEQEVKLILNNCVITNSSNSPIFAYDADKVIVNSEEGSYNEINDNRDSSTAAANDEDETIGKGAIYAKCDLNIAGKGSLVVNSTYNNGIHTTKDLKIKNVTTKVTAINNALKGNDSITIESGNITAISSGGDGLKTSDTDISSKGNQRGTISITGGTIDIYAACDGIDASYNVEISDEAVVNVYTDKYSEYTGEIVSSSDSSLYIYVPSNYYSNTYRYAIYYYNDDISSGKWENATYYAQSESNMGMGRPGETRGASYYYKVDYPTSYQNYRLYRFESSQSENSLDTYNACSTGSTINTYYDTLKVSTISSGKITTSWTRYQTNDRGGSFGSGGMQESNSNKTEYSAKGIKADNLINISGGNIFVKSSDDAIHANNDNALENGENPEGDVVISGGNIQVYTLDDGIHADYCLYIKGGTINVVNAYEGLEGNTIKVSGGDTTIYATDDGINAAGDMVTPSIEVSGGRLDVTIGTGDVDGIDSNGTYTQSGGVVITRAGQSSTGRTSNMATGLDCTSTASLTGGTFISLGTTETTLSTKLCKASYTSSVSKGTYKLEELDISFTLVSSYSGIYIYSELLKTGSSYTISGQISKTWTQSATSTTIK